MNDSHQGSADPVGPLLVDPPEDPSGGYERSGSGPPRSAPRQPTWVRPAQRIARAAGRWGWRLNLLMFLATLVTTTLAGALLFSPHDPSAGLVQTMLGDPIGFLAVGLGYSIPVILILGAHEMGHYLFCRYYGVAATLPYFIPAPHLFGTFGAVIRMRPPLPSRKALFDIGIAGPLAGFVMAVPLLAYGLLTARIVHVPPGVYLSFADPPLIRIMSSALHTSVPAGSTMESGALHAVWFGLLMTAMNLFPVGQLDGGHVVFAISHRLHTIASRVTIMAMLAFVAGGLIVAIAGPAGLPTGAVPARVLGAAGALLIVALYAGWSRLKPAIARLVVIGMIMLAFGCLLSGIFTPWLIWTIILVVMGRSGHPPVQGQGEPVGYVRIALAVAALIIFLLCFMPVPFEEITLS